MSYRKGPAVEKHQTVLSDENDWGWLTAPSGKLDETKSIQKSEVNK